MEEHKKKEQEKDFASMTFAEQVDAVLSGAVAETSHLEVMKTTPPLLRMVGLPNLPLLMTAKHLRTITQDSGTESVNYHGLNVEIVKRLPELLADPVMIMDSLTRDDSIVVVTQATDSQNRPVIGAVKIKGIGRINSEIVSANILTSAYGKDSFETFISRNFDAKTILYADKEKSQALSVNPGIQFSDVMTSLSFNTIIRKAKAFVNSEEQKNSANKENLQEEKMMDETNTTEPNKTTEARAKAQRLVQETGEPYVTIEFSENSAFDSGDVLPLSVADKKLAKLDAEHEGDGYDKVTLHIDYIKDGKPDSYEGCRFDIGDEQQGLVSHIQSFWQFYLDNKNWRKRLESEHSPDYVKSAYEEYERMAHDVAPFLKRHVELADMIESAQSVSDFTAEDVASVRAHVARERAELNGVPAAAENGEHEKKDGVIERVTPKVSTPTDGVDKPQEPAPVNYRDKVTEIRDTMIQAILTRIEKDPLNWSAGWNKVSGNPVNGKTDTAYRGLNSIYLYLMSEQHGYNDPRWVTFNQAKALGASIKKGEKSYPVLFYERYDKLTKKEYDPKTTKSMTEEERAEYERENVRFVLKYYSVFNAAQCVNFPELDKSALLMSEEERANQNELIETIIANSAAPVNYDGGSRAYYQPSTDSIHLPAIENFHSMQDYYATALHEIAHSTGHASRLNRDLSGGFGSQSYAVEELRAELACVFMQIEHGITIEGNHIDNHAAYVQRWLEAAKSDPTVFYKAVRDAGKIADYVDDNYLQAILSDAKEEVTEEIKAEERANVNKLEENVREWYTSTFPSDELGADLDGGLSFGDVVDALSKGENIYDVLGVEDSIVRERVFGRLAELQDKSYEEIYDTWANASSRQEGEHKEKTDDFADEMYDYISSRTVNFNKAQIMLNNYDALQSFEAAFLADMDGDSDEFFDALDEESPEIKNKATELYNELGYEGFVDLYATHLKIVDQNNVKTEEEYKRFLIEQVPELQTSKEIEHKEENEYRALKIVLNNARNGEPLTEYITFQGSNYLIKVSDLLMKFGGEERDGNYYITPAVEEKFAELQSKYENEEHKEETVNGTPHYSIEFRLGYQNEMLLSNAFGELGFKIDPKMFELNEQSDISAMDSGEERWINALRYIGQNGRELQGYFGRTFNGIMLEATDITGFTTSGMSEQEVQAVAKAIRSFGVNVDIKEIPTHNAQFDGEHKEKISPLYQKYIETQRKHPNAFIFQRVGDFYEVIGETAKEVASRLDLTLTSRDVGLAKRTPMVGVPYHAIDTYIAKLREFGDVVIEREEGRFEELRQHVETVDDIQKSGQLEGQTSIFELPQEQGEHKEENKSGGQPENGVQRNISAGQTQKTPRREWFNIDLPEGSLGKRYGENTMIKMPQGEYEYYALFLPTRLIKTVDGKQQLRIASDLTYRLNNDGRQVKLTGLELRDSFAGMQIGKDYKRVAPSRMYAKTFADLERNVPVEMKALPNWCVYRTFQREDKDKKGKVLKSAVTGEGASSKRKSDWTDFDTALKYAKENGFAGVSFLLEAKNGITCVDLDECIANAETGEMKERAAKLVESLKGTYMERSTSGNGVHIFLKDDILKGGRYRSTSVDAQKGDLEVYDDNRVISMTGNMFSDTNDLTRAGSAAMFYLRAELGEQKHFNGVSADTRPKPASSLSLSDNELIARIRASKKGRDFDDLYSGKGISGNKSNDDAKLAHLLLYFNEGDKEQAFRIMRESGANRPDKPDSYYRHTVDNMDKNIQEYVKRPTNFSGKGPQNPGGRRGDDKGPRAGD